MKNNYEMKYTKEAQKKLLEPKKTHWLVKLWNVVNQRAEP